MNVAIFTDNDFDKVNGVTTTLRAVLEHAPPGVHVRVYTAARTPIDTPPYLAVEAPGIPLPFYGEMRIYAPPLRRLRRAAQADAVDVIHLTTPGPIGLAAMRVARQLGVPMVGSFHTDLAAYARILSGSSRLGAAMGQFMRWPYGRCARVLAPSEATRRLLMRTESDGDRIGIWRRGVDNACFHPERRNEALRRRWGVSDARPAILYVGRVSREKGLDLLPRIQNALHRLGLPHRLIIVGQGPMREELEAQLPDAVFTGVLDRDGVAEACASSDVFVFPSRTDTAGNVVLEAQASGLPVLVTNAGGPQENVVDGESGHVLHDMAPASWAATLAPLLRRPARRQRMAAAARAYAESRTWMNALAPLFDAYRDVAVTARALPVRGSLVTGRPTLG
jgi:glycosyltransferase involved in cell wall biosynthesis